MRCLSPAACGAAGNSKSSEGDLAQYDTSAVISQDMESLRQVLNTISGAIPPIVADDRYKSLNL